MQDERIAQLEKELSRYKTQEELIQKFFSLELYKLGQAFFDKTVQLLAELLEVDYAFIGQLNGLESVTTTSLFAKGEIAKNFTYELADTPCSNVIDTGPCIYEEQVADLFPNDELLTSMGIEGYVGVPLFNSEGSPLGILVLLHSKAIRDPKLAESFLLMFAGRASAELEHYNHARELEQRNAELLEAKQAAEESDRLKTAFLANMSHEIRTPLNAILGFSSLLAEPDTSSEETREYTDLIKTHGESLLLLVDDVITLSRIEAERVQFEPAPLRLRRFLQETLDSFHDKAAEKSEALQLQLQTAEDLPETFVVDPHYFGQCLRRLLSNAIKFTSSGTITLSCKRSETDLIFAVADTGPGVNEEVADLIFKRFTQAENGPTRTHGGSGLGLAITKSLVEKMGGQITVETTSQRDTGALFEIRLPV